jgi:hypothetical protein
MQTVWQATVGAAAEHYVHWWLRRGGLVTATFPRTSGMCSLKAATKRSENTETCAAALGYAH